MITDGGLASLVACWAEGSLRRRAEAAGRGRAFTASVAFAAASASGPGPARAAAALQAELSGLGELIPGSSSEASVARGGDAGRGDGPAVGGSHDGLAATRTLIDAGSVAIALGLRRIVWPILAEPTSRGGDGRQAAGEKPIDLTPADNGVDLDSVARACDRAILAATLLGIDALPTHSSTASEGEPVRIETPYVDFTDGQLLELALDMDAPLEPDGSGGGGEGAAAAVWWCVDGPPTSGVSGVASAGPCGRCGPCTRWVAAWREAGLRVTTRAVSTRGRVADNLLHRTPCAPR